MSAVVMWMGNVGQKGFEIRFVCCFKRRVVCRFVSTRM